GSEFISSSQASQHGSVKSGIGSLACIDIAAVSFGVDSTLEATTAKAIFVDLSAAVDVELVGLASLMALFLQHLVSCGPYPHHEHTLSSIHCLTSSNGTPLVASLSFS